MASLLEIRQQITGVKNTRKITKAMELVAASKSQKFQKKAISIRNFAFGLVQTLNRVNAQNIESQFLQTPSQAEKVLFVLYSSDKGLCGALNSRLFKILFRSEHWTKADDSLRDVISIGKKAQSFLSFNKIPTIEAFEGLDEKMDQFAAIEYIEQILKHWNTKQYKSVYIVAPHFQNAFTFFPVLKQLLPLSDDLIGAHKEVDPESVCTIGDAETMMLFEPSKEEVAKKIIRQIVEVVFLQCFYELKASEYSSRMIAMKNATDNADDIIHEKTLIMNKARQAKITQEIAEIVGASFI